MSDPRVSVKVSTSIETAVEKVARLAVNAALAMGGSLELIEDEVRRAEEALSRGQTSPNTFANPALVAAVRAELAKRTNS